MSLEAIVIQAGQGKALSLRGTQVAYKAEGQRPAGGPTFLEFTAAPGFNTGDHIHRQIEEIFYVVEGEFQIRAGDRSLRAKPGDFVLVPPGVPHGFANPIGGPAKMVLLISPAITLAAAAERYLGLKARKRTIAEDRRTLEHLKAVFGETTLLTQITADRISTYKAQRLATMRRIGETERSLTAAAVNRPLAVLCHLLRLAHDEWGVLERVPKIRTEKESQGRLRWLTRVEATNLLAACRKSKNKALPDLVEFCMFTGVRRGEALALTWDRVDRSRGVVRLELSKSGRRREVPLSSNADGVLARRWTPDATGYVFGKRNWNAFRSAWEAVLATAGLEGFRFHDLRHTFASWLVQRGRTLKEVQEALGHQTITMTMRYSHLAPDHLRAAVAVLDGVLSAPESETTKVSAQGSAQAPVAVSEVSAN